MKTKTSELIDGSPRCRVRAWKYHRALRPGESKRNRPRQKTLVYEPGHWIAYAKLGQPGLSGKWIVWKKPVSKPDTTAYCDAALVRLTCDILRIILYFFFRQQIRRWQPDPWIVPWRVIQTLPATCEKEAPWETRVQDKENKPQVRNISTQVHALLIFFLPQCTLLIELAALLVKRKCLIKYCSYNPR